jgi:hypothetical protein
MDFLALGGVQTLGFKWVLLGCSLYPIYFCEIIPQKHFWARFHTMEKRCINEHWLLLFIKNSRRACQTRKFWSDSFSTTVCV